MTQGNLKMDSITDSLMLLVLAPQINVELAHISLQAVVQHREMPTVSCLTKQQELFSQIVVVQVDDSPKWANEVGAR
jgi:hypothetical protein